MALTLKKYNKATLSIETVAYNIKVPFYRYLSVCEHTLDANDTLAPLTWSGVSAFANPIPGFGAWYRLIGDGTHSPSFDAAFKKVDGSGTFDSTLNAINLIKFFYDGVTYWYEIIQPE
jgi:hypothetical protein